jgi:hypothetical protein
MDELSFVLIQALSSAMVRDDVFSAVTAASLLSNLIDVFLTRAAFRWADRKNRTRLNLLPGMLSGRNQTTGQESAPQHLPADGPAPILRVGRGTSNAAPISTDGQPISSC